ADGIAAKWERVAVRSAGERERRRQRARGQRHLGVGQGVHARGRVAAAVRNQRDPGASDRMNRRWIGAGVATAVLYVLVAQLSFRVGLFPARPLYDGGGPPSPYRWVNPPPDLKQG